jgi:hypothetical protein
MTRGELLAYQKKEKAFAETEIGKAFLKFKAAYHKAIARDTEDSFTDKNRRSTQEAWKEALETERAFRALLDPFVP